MVAAVSLISVMFGVTLSRAADRFPTHVEALEMGGGAMLVAGLALLGSALPVVL